MRRAGATGDSLRTLPAARLWPLAALAAAALLAAGVSVPVMTVRSVIVFQDQFSILGSLRLLLEGGEYVLFALLLVFSLLFPFGRLGVAAYLWAFVPPASARFKATLRVVAALGRWSMVEVLLLALVIVAVKLSALGDAWSNPGLYVFSAAIVAQIGCFAWLKALARGRGNGEN